MVKYVDLNADMGESFGRYKIGQDEILVRYVTSANIACGFHAGDPVVMRKTVKLCIEHGVGVGAHPGFPDLMGFGRRAMEVKPEELEAYIIYQVSALMGMARSLGVEIQHVKVHGALYNMAWIREDYAGAIARAVKSLNANLILVAPYGSAMVRKAEELGIPVAYEGFIERGYTREGRLVPRGKPGALIHDPEEAASRAIRMVSEGKVKSVDGVDIDIVVHTLCIHSDSPNAGKIASTVRQRLEEVGIKVVPLRQIIKR